MFKVVDHPLVKDKLTRIRKSSTESTKFRENLEELTKLMIYEVTKDFELKNIDIETPVAKAIGYKLKYNTVLVPILRAGLGMVDGVKSLIPTAAIGHIGLYRNEETLKPVEYYCKMPPTITDSYTLVLDPMLATGGSAIAAIEMLKTKYKPRKIIFVCTVASPEGVSALQKAHPEIDIYAGALDEKLNSNGYIVPGLGDAGDRIFGTK